MNYSGVIGKKILNGKITVRGAVTPDNGDSSLNFNMKKFGFVKRILDPVDSSYVIMNSIDQGVVNSISKKSISKGEFQHGKGKRRN